MFLIGVLLSFTNIRFDPMALILIQLFHLFSSLSVGFEYSVDLDTNVKVNRYFQSSIIGDYFNV